MPREKRDPTGAGLSVFTDFDAALATLLGEGCDPWSDFFSILLTAVEPCTPRPLAPSSLQLLKGLPVPRQVLAKTKVGPLRGDFRVSIELKQTNNKQTTNKTLPSS